MANGICKDFVSMCQGDNKSGAIGTNAMFVMTPDKVTNTPPDRFPMSMLEGPAQDLPKFQIPCLTTKSVHTCSIHSPDGDRSFVQKIDLFMTNGCPVVGPPEVTSD